jgi:hypothetical protein
MSPRSFRSTRPGRRSAAKFVVAHALSRRRGDNTRPALIQDHIGRPIIFRRIRETATAGYCARFYRNMTSGRFPLVQTTAIFRTHDRPCKRECATEYGEYKTQNHRLLINVHASSSGRPESGANGCCWRSSRSPGFVSGFNLCLNEETRPAAVLFLRMPTCLDPDNAPTRRARGRIDCLMTLHL